MRGVSVIKKEDVAKFCLPPHPRTGEPNYEDQSDEYMDENAYLEE